MTLGQAAKARLTRCGHLLYPASMQCVRSRRQNSVLLGGLLLAISGLQFCSPASTPSSRNPRNTESPQNPDPSTNNPTPPPPPAPNPGRQEYDAKQAEQMAWAAHIRYEMLEQATRERNWTKKFTPLAQYFAHYDFQRWEPFDSYSKDVADFEALMDSAVGDFLALWQANRASVAPTVLRDINVYDDADASNFLLALSLTCDQINSKQLRNAYKYRFRALSPEDILSKALKKYAQGDVPTNNVERRVFEYKNLSTEILHWRYNGILRWTYAQLISADPSTRPSGVKTLTFVGKKVGDLEAIASNLERALTTRQELLEISVQPQVNAGVQSRLNKLNVEKAELEISSMSNSKKKELAQEILNLLDELVKTF